MKNNDVKSMFVLTSDTLVGISLYSIRRVTDEGDKMGQFMNISFIRAKKIR